MSFICFNLPISAHEHNPDILTMGIYGNMIQTSGVDMVLYVVNSLHSPYDHCLTGQHLPVSDAIQSSHDPGLRCWEVSSKMFPETALYLAQFLQSSRI